MRLLSIFFFLYVYAAIRYHIGKGQIEFIYFPFVINKAIAWTAGTFFVMSVLPNAYLQHAKLSRRMLGVWGYRLAIIHIIGSIVMLSPILYPKFYSEGTLNMEAWRHIAFGALSIILFSFPLWASIQDAPSNDWKFRFGRWGIAFNLAHVVSIGFSGWFTFKTWPLFMPPITLLFVSFGVIILIYRYLILKGKH
jgi:hypothetical protein